MLSHAQALKKVTFIRFTILMISSLLIISCAGTSPKSNFYTLNSQINNTKNDENLNKNLPTLSIHIASVLIDETVDRPQLVIRTSQNRVEILEQQRWAQPLKNEISRVVAEHLSAILATNKVTTFPLPAIKPDYIVTIQVQTFESKLSENAKLRAYWGVRRTADNMQVNDTLITTEGIPGAIINSYDALIAAHNQNLNRLSTDIAKTIITMSAIPNH